MTDEQSDYDSPWKEAIEVYFADCIAFFLPEAYAAIDWSRGYVFLDKELQRVVPDAAVGRRLVDKLAQVWLRDGHEAWVLIHIEVQGEPEAAFAERIYIYNSRLYHYSGREVNSLAILADTRTRWRPRQFRYGRWGTELRFSFPIVKLADYRKRWAELEASTNPFATVVMAHLKAQDTQKNPQERGQWKWLLTRRLYERGYRREDILQLFRFIDWIMHLPHELQLSFRQQVYAYEEEQRMPYITSIERMGIEKGRAEGRVEGRAEGRAEGQYEELLSAIELMLNLRFGEAGRALLPEISQVAEYPVLRAVRDQIWTVDQPEDLRQIYQSDPQPGTE
jgi:hypothetical protein